MPEELFSTVLLIMVLLSEEDLRQMPYREFYTLLLLMVLLEEDSR